MSKGTYYLVRPLFQRNRYELIDLAVTVDPEFHNVAGLLVGIDVLAQVVQFSDRYVVDADNDVAVGAGVKVMVERCAGQNAVDDYAVIYRKVALLAHLRRDGGTVDWEPSVLRRYACAQIGQYCLDPVNGQRKGDAHKAP